MDSYNYIAVNSAGRELKGTIVSDSIEKAREDLKKQGLLISSLGTASALTREVSISFLEKKPKARDMAVFCRQFVSIVDAGVSVVAAFEMLPEQTENKKLRAAISDCRLDMEKGDALAVAMRRHTEVFPDIFVTMVEAGEASGSLDVSFGRMATQFEKQEKLHATVKKASIYPIIVCIVALAVVIGMLTFVIPKFEDMFADLGTELPGITLFVLAASQFFQKKWYILAAIVGAAFVGIKTFKQTDAGRHFFGKISMKAPLVGNLTVKSASAQMARTLSTLLASGISMIDALDICSGTMGNIYFKEALLAAKEDVAVGNPLSESFTRTNLFPALVRHMVGIGEETGDIEKMLDKLADYYEDEVEQATEQVMAALEPMIIVLLAGIVGTIILSVVMPMGTMYSALDNL